ncbi:MAG: preprotein translocase subunit SecG [Gemmatimonadetes bacterium]|nr:preprotein translocase subunit SecG [Gemmatimonadota bacterium]
MFTFLLILLILDAVVLVTVVLLQAGQGGGLAAMSGGASTDTFLGGRQAVTILTKMSWWCGGVFLALSLVLAGLSSRGSRPRSVLEGQIQPPAPVAPLPLNVQPATPGTSTAPPAGAPATPKPEGRD